jgi:iron complex transport system permease protein
MLGSVQPLELPELVLSVLSVGVCAAVLLRWAAAVNALSFGDDLARALGFDGPTVRRMTLLLVSLLVSVSVASAGSVGFVGLIVPHIARRFSAHALQREWITSALWGGALLVAGDILARTVAAPSELPVGLFTALIGTPALAVILLRRRPGEVAAA